jgi:SanA protein
MRELILGSRFMGVSLPKRLAMFLVQLVVSLFTVAILIFGYTNFVVVTEGNKSILQEPAQKKLTYVIVLGAGVHGFELSGALKARMEIAVSLVQQNLAESILLSGDGTETYYNETRAMQMFALQQGVQPNQIYLDPKGYSTYDSMVQAKKLFNVDTAYIVSQRFHLPRVLWLAEALGILALGVPTEPIENEAFYAFREIPARTKDYLLHFLEYVPHGRRGPPLR